MKKSPLAGLDLVLPVVKKLLLIMKLAILLVVITALQASAHVYSQQKLTLNFQRTEIARILSSIEKQGTYRFLYNDNLPDIRLKVDFQVTDVTIDQAMSRLLANTHLTYQLMDNNLVVIKDNESAPPPQDVNVTGTVTAENGNPLVGVSVLVKGTKRGTLTNSMGQFSLKVPVNGVLVVSYVGYVTKEMRVTGEGNISVVLSASNEELQQVVVVGYGTQRKIDITGATATVKGAELVKQPVMTATQALQGKAAGVQIIASGQPGIQPSVRIRGTGSMLGGAEPLYVVDGVITNDITNINTADIVDVDILKDASSTAIYGARGANGVIIITTKQGTPGKMRISYNGNVGITSATNLIKMANAQQYLAYEQAALGPNLSPTGYNTNWYGQILRNAVEQSHSITLSGATDKTKYLLGIGYSDDQGIVITNDYKRFDLRSNDEFTIANHLRLGTYITYTNGSAQNANLATAYNDAYRASPLVPAIVDGKYGNTSLFQNVGNPILDIRNNDNHTGDNRLQGNAFLEYKPLAWLTLKSSLGADWDDQVNRVYNYQFYADTSTFSTPGGNQSNEYSNLSVTSANSLHWVWDNTATFHQRFGMHDLTVLVGTTAEQISSSYVTATVEDVPPNPSLWYIGNGNSSLPFSNGGGGAIQTRDSYLGRVNYVLNDKYLFTGTVRQDASSTFPVNNRHAVFPSFGGGWVLSRENFMKNQQVFDLIKVRASWGEAGNDVTGTGTQGYTTTLLENLPYFFGGAATAGAAISALVDKNLKWETSTESDVAVEFSALDARLNGEISYYSKVTKNSLIYVLIPSTLGSYNPNGQAGYVLTNAASVQNKGVEVTLGWKDRIGKDFSYSVGGNITFNNNEVVGLNGGQPYIDGPVGADQPDVTKTASGHPIGSYYVQKVLGVFQNQAEINGYTDKNGTILQPGAQPGDFKYQFNSNGQLDSVYAGSYQPKAYYGINLGANYKRFDLSIGCYGSMGAKIYNGRKAFRQSLLDNIDAATANSRWTNSNHSETQPRANGGDLPASTYFVENGSFLRINNVNLGYTFNEASIQRSKVFTSLRVYISAQNPLTIKKYSGFTPELQPSSPTAAGVDLNSYPSVKTFSAGVNVGL